jgi:hypothetical protein
MKSVVDNAAGPTGAIGILIGKFTANISEWLIFFSILLVLCQLSHWAYRFFKWLKGKK